MANSLKRIGAWAKQHPWVAAAVIAAVVIIGYLVYKRARSSSQQGAGTAADETGMAIGGGGGAEEDGIPTFIPMDIPGSISSGGEFSLPSSLSGLSNYGYPALTEYTPTFASSQKEGKIYQVASKAIQPPPPSTKADKTFKATKTFVKADKTFKAKTTADQKSKTPWIDTKAPKLITPSQKDKLQPIPIQQVPTNLFSLVTQSFAPKPAVASGGVQTKYIAE